MAYNPNTYTADGSTTEFAITFPFLREADIVVSVFDASGNVVSAFDFEIFLDGSFKARVVADGTITDNTPTALPANYTVTISRNTDISTLGTTFVDGVSLRAADINILLNQQNYALQEFGRNTQEALGKNVTDTAWDATSLRITNLAQPTADNDAIRKVDVDSGIGPDITTVAGISSAVTTLGSGTDSSGRLHRLNIEDVADDLNLGANSDITTVATDIRTGGNNHVQAVSNSIANVDTLAGNDTDGTAHLVNIETVAEDLTGSNTIGTVAGSIANVNTLAGNDAGGTAHLTNISDLAPQVTNIDTLASGTDSGGTAYLTHLENAATNAAAAQAALEAFNRTYLGAYSADPTVDNNGDPLTDGDLYYNTTSNNLKFYDAGNTVWVTLNNSVQVNAAATLGATGDVNFTTETHQDFIMRDNSNPAKWVNVSPSVARTNLGLGTVANTNSYSDLDNRPTLGTAAAAATTDFATAAQGALADTALQPGDIIDNLTSTSTTDVLSAAQGKTLNDTKQDTITTSTALAAASLTTVTDAGNTVDVRRADRIAQASSVNVDGGATLYDVTATATLTLSDLVAGDIVTVFSRSGTTTIARGTITYAYIDGDIATNKTNVTVGAGTLATVTMVSNDTAIIAGSDLT